jgi:hypothetical protein
MPAHNKHRLFKLVSAVWNIFRLALTAFQPDVSVWDSGYLVGLPTSLGLASGISQHRRETSESVVFVTNMKLLLSETHVLDGEQCMVKLKPVMLPTAEGLGGVSLLTAQAMIERYRLASGQSSLHSKETQNSSPTNRQ